MNIEHHLWGTLHIHVIDQCRYVWRIKGWIDIFDLCFLPHFHIIQIFTLNFIRFGLFYPLFSYDFDLLTPKSFCLIFQNLNQYPPPPPPPNIRYLNLPPIYKYKMKLTTDYLFQL